MYLPILGIRICHTPNHDVQLDLSLLTSNSHVLIHMYSRQTDRQIDRQMERQLEIDRDKIDRDR